MALLPSVTQIPAQRVPLNERPQPPEYVSREWYRFFNALGQIAKNNATINVKDFGAVGDGVTDDTAAIQAAVDFVASAGGIVWFPSGTFLHGTTITLKSNVTLFGYGAVLKWSGGSAVQTTTASSGVTENIGVHGLTFDGGANASGCLALRSVYFGSFTDLSFVSSNASNVILLLTVNTSGSVNNDGNRNTAFLNFVNLLQDGTCGTFIRMIGDATAPTVVTLCSFSSVNSRGASVCGIDFASWCDSNYFSGVTRLSLVANNSVGVEWNTASPTTNVGVYANNFDHLAVDTFGALTGRVGIRMNWTKINTVNYFFQDPPAEGGAYVFSANAQSYRVLHQPGLTSNMVLRQKLSSFAGADQPITGFASDGEISTQTCGVEVATNRTGNGFSYLSLVGDTTYTTYGTRLLRTNSGANADSRLLHRGTGNLIAKAEDAGGQVVLETQNGVKVVASDTGVGFYGAAASAKPTITGSRGGNAALASLLTALGTLGLLTDNTTS
jgi:hypothetical protein